MKLVDKALALDSRYARAHAMKSFFVNNLASHTTRLPAELANGLDDAVRHAKVALSIAPQLPIAHSALAYAYWRKLRVRESLREHKFAFSLASGDSDVIRNYGYDEISATDVLTYVASIFARGEIKGD